MLNLHLSPMTTQKFWVGIIPILQTGNLEIWEINDLPQCDMDGQYESLISNTGVWLQVQVLFPLICPLAGRWTRESRSISQGPGYYLQGQLTEPVTLN